MFNLFARIAQMESSRIVGGSAQTQALLRAPNETSQRDVGRGRFDRPAGSRGAVTKYTSGAEIIRMPSGSIVSIPPLEPRNLSQSHIDKTLLLALLVNFGIWGLLALGFRLIFRF